MDPRGTFCVRPKSPSRRSGGAALRYGEPRHFDFPARSCRMHPEERRVGVHSTASSEEAHDKVHPDVLRIRMLRELVMLKHDKEGRNLLNSYIKYRMEMARMESWIKFIHHCKTLSVVPPRFRLKNIQIKKTEFLSRILYRYSDQIMRADLKLIRKRTAQLKRIIGEKVQRMRLLFGEQLLSEALEVTHKAYRRRLSIMDSEHDKELRHLSQRPGTSQIEQFRRRGLPRESRLGAFGARDCIRVRSIRARTIPPRLTPEELRNPPTTSSNQCLKSEERRNKEHLGSGPSIEGTPPRDSRAECRQSSSKTPPKPGGSPPSGAGQSTEISEPCGADPTERASPEQSTPPEADVLGPEPAERRATRCQADTAPYDAHSFGLQVGSSEKTEPTSETLQRDDPALRVLRDDDSQQGAVFRGDAQREETLAHYEELITRLQNILERRGQTQLGELEPNVEKSILAPSPKARELPPRDSVCSNSCINRSNDVSFVETTVLLVWEIFLGIAEYVLGLLLPAK